MEQLKQIPLAENAYGYIRVSTREQNEERQRLALKEAGVGQQRLFVDKQSGKNFDRPQYRRLVRRLREGDLLCVKALTGWAATTRKFWSSGAI